MKSKICISIDMELLKELDRIARNKKPQVSRSYLIEYYIRLGMEYERRFSSDLSALI